jgi:uncharacterized protein YceK
MQYVVLFLAFALNGCSSVAPPVVDQRGIDPAKYAADQSECVANNTAAITFGAPITACMKAKGYTILIPRS